jgi:tetratricopeptide (TPR) repeat protein
MAWRSIFVALLAALAFASPAQAQQLTFERYAAQCNDDGGAFTADESINACTQIIRSDFALGHALAAAYNSRAIRYLQKREDDHALSDFSQAIHYSPHYAQAFFNRASLYLLRRDFPHALADYDSVIGILPDQQIGYTARCWARALWGQELDRARVDCERALGYNPHSVESLNSRAMINLRENRWQDAFSDYNTAAETDPANARSIYGRGLAELRLGRTQEAQHDLAAAAEIDARVAQTFAEYGVTP